MISIEDIEGAARRLDGVAIETPLLQNAELDRIAGGTVLLKPECLQRTGSFKIRGAYNLLSQLPGEQARHGAVPGRQATTLRESPPRAACWVYIPPSSCPKMHLQPSLAIRAGSAAR